MEPAFLRANAVKPATLARYRECSEAVASFARSAGLPTVSHHDWDVATERFLERLYAAGDGAATARYVLFGVIFVNDLPARSALTMPLSRKALQGFIRLVPERMRDPPPLAALWILVHELLEGAPGAAAVGAAAALLLGFDAYLRPSETLKLLREHVTAPRRVAGVQDWVITVAPAGGEPAKNKQFDCGVVVGAHGRRWARDILEALYRRAAPGQALLGEVTLAQLEAAVRLARGRAMLPSKLSLDLHAARHAGPSHDAYFHGARIEELQARGRWAILESCRRYAKPAKLLRGIAMLSDEQVRTGERYAQLVPPRLIALIRGDVNGRAMAQARLASVGRKRHRAVAC